MERSQIAAHARRTAIIIVAIGALRNANTPSVITNFITQTITVAGASSLDSDTAPIAHVACCATGAIGIDSALRRAGTTFMPVAITNLVSGTIRIGNTGNGPAFENHERKGLVTPHRRIL